MASSKQPLTPSSALRHRRCLIGSLSALLALALVLLILFLTVLRVRDPTIRLVSTELAGVTPRFALLPGPSLHLNVTLLLTVSVHNPNPASFAYAEGGQTDLSYRGAHVGDAQIGPGAVPSRGDAEARLALTLQADRFLAAGDARQLAEDIQGGALPLDAATRVPGTVVLFGLFTRRAVAYSECTLVFVHNPNPASFAYAEGGQTDLSYRGAHVGDAQIGPGAVPSRGDAEARLALTLQADRFLAAGDARQLAEDIQGGALPLDAATRVPGTVVLFGLFTRRAVAYSECTLVFAVAQMRVQSHECSGHTKL